MTGPRLIDAWRDNRSWWIGVLTFTSAVMWFIMLTSSYPTDSVPLVSVITTAAAAVSWASLVYDRLRGRKQ